MGSYGMNAVRSIMFFGLPGLAMTLGVRLMVPYTLSRGWPLIVSYPLFLWGPVVLLLAGVILRFRHQSAEGTEGFAQRFRLRRPGRRELALAGGGFLAVQLLELALVPTRRILASHPLMAAPPSTPELFDPNFQIEAGLSELFGVPLEGNWWLIAFWLGWLVINIGGEELLWRGWALPLQERVFGKWAWLLNGLLWNVMVHAFMPWGYFTLLPISLILPYLVQRTGNTWVGVIIHGVGNLLVLAVIIPGIVG